MYGSGRGFSYHSTVATVSPRRSLAASASVIRESPPWSFDLIIKITYIHFLECAVRSQLAEVLNIHDITDHVHSDRDGVTRSLTANT